MGKSFGRLVATSAGVAVAAALLLCGCSPVGASGLPDSSVGQAVGSAAVTSGLDSSDPSSASTSTAVPSDTPAPTPTASASASAPKTAPGAPSSGSSTLTVWSSGATCPASFVSELQAVYGSSITVTSEPPTQATGLAPDPGLTTGDVPTCDLQLQSSAETSYQYYFFGMPSAWFGAFGSRLTAAGFSANAAAPTSNGNSQDYDRNGANIMVIYYAPSADLPSGYVMVTNP